MASLKNRGRKIYFLTVHRRDRSPSQRFRFEQYTEFFDRNGFKCIHSYLINESDDKIFYSRGKLFGKFRILLKSITKRIIEILLIGRKDIVFVQRESIMIGTSFFEKILSKKARLIYDFDDSIWIKNISKSNEGFGWLKSPDKIPEIMKSAHHIIAGNKYLADYARNYNGNIDIIPTTIDMNKYQLGKEKEFVEPYCIGWSGSFSTIQHFELVIPALKDLKKKYRDKIYFKVIGDENYECKDLNLTGIKWDLKNEINELSEIDIGIMPLPDDEWSRGKCGLKGLQYMSLGIPTIMSPVGINKEIITDGQNGFLARNKNEWIDKISFLIEQPDNLSKIGIQGQKTIMEKYSVKANKYTYLNVLQNI